jgi:pimeloyl-ACP methyl ester carboxylesterase
MPEHSTTAIAESRFITAPDGLQLHVRCYRAAWAALRLPVICLPGLTRNESDFEPLARNLATNPEHPRAVFALDLRGRGRSDHDPDWRNYNPAVELADVIAVAKALGLARAVFLGTSRGGILTMLMAAAQPQMIAGAILNDIGPVIDLSGLMRIKGYAGKIRTPKDVAEGAAILRDLFGTQFPNLGEADWRAWAERSWAQGAGGLIGRYDQKIGETLKDVSPDQAVPDLWPQFDALPDVPLMLIRGALTDILSQETVGEMRRRRPDIDVVEVPDQGHAPLLAEPAVIRRISDFLQRCDRKAAGR